MKYLLFLIMCLGCLQVEAIHFQNSMFVTPINVNEYFVEIEIQKVDEFSPLQVVASPKIICTVGKPAKLSIESDDKADLLSISVLISEHIAEKSILTQILMKEKGKIVISVDNVIQLNS